MLNKCHLKDKHKNIFRSWYVIFAYCNSTWPPNCLSGGSKFLQVHFYIHAHRYVDILKKIIVQWPHPVENRTHWAAHTLRYRQFIQLHTVVSHAWHLSPHETHAHIFFHITHQKFLIRESLCTKRVQVVKKGKKTPAYSNFLCQVSFFPTSNFNNWLFYFKQFSTCASAASLHLHCDDSIEDMTVAASITQTEKQWRLRYVISLVWPTWNTQTHKE